ncbi:AraC family transcriptional regulator [Paenibacillus albidus]|uniref:AraC family transcriptional regulator n=1 Tax=Paenibacillus albidus TaxID=2041023 RepID=UPI002035A746|nr:AraC family transcriptional regulator [Paenibacillus albidus]
MITVQLGDQLLLWNQASILVKDVRHMIMETGETSSYRLPASAFLYTVRGNARIRLDGKTHAVSRFHILHGGKGLCLDISADACFEYYLVLYKAALPHPTRRELLNIMETNNPFIRQFGFIPQYPLSLLDKVKLMDKVWHQSSALEKLQVKALFYQFMVEVMGQLSQKGVQSLQPDPVAQAMRYIQEHYREHVTLELLADMLDCSSRQLLRMFKSKENISPIDYLIRVRMHKAQELLLSADCTLKEIAERVGYTDSYYFSRLFKKVVGVSPTLFKGKVLSLEVRPDNPLAMSGSSIVENKLQRYIDNEYDNHYQYKRGDSPVYRKNKAPMAVTLLFCLSLLLTACSAGTANNSAASNGNQSAGTNTAAEQTASSAANSADADAPRVVKHAMGEETLTGTPERVVILTNEGTEALLALGVKPVGAVQSWNGEPWYEHIKDEMQGVEVVGDELQPNIELIASLKPDLIIGNKVRQEKIYEQLKQIAPTVFSEDLSGEWKNNFRLYSEALNKKEEGEKAMEAFDSRVADVKSKLGSKAETKVSIVRFSASQVRIYQKDSFSGVLLEQLGIARPASQDKDNFMEVMSKETIPDMDGDVLFYFVTETEDTSDAAKVVEEWKNDPLFKNLNVSKNNKVFEVNETIWNTAGGYEAANLLLDELVKYFEVK